LVFATALLAAALLPGLGCIPTAPGGVTMVAPEVRFGDCDTAEQGLEFAPFMIEDFEGARPNFMYTYTDNTSVITPSGYLPVTETGKHCNSDSGNNVFHTHGGPFLGWGGGLGVSMLHLGRGNGNGDANGLCNHTPLPDYCVPDGPDPNVTQSVLDFSQWDGVALWARRGPTGQPLLRVLIGNKYTDDDISFFMYDADPTQPRYCERVRECACINGLDCAFSPDEDNGGPPGVIPGGGLYCGTPGLVMGPDISVASTAMRATNTCGVTRCDDVYPAHPEVGPDPEFANRQCRPFTYRSGVTSSFCYNADDPLPAETDQQCGDHWTYPLHLTTDWQLYLVPFSWMYQQGFAKRFSSFDLKSVSVARLTWDGGPVDFYVDNWRLYRVKRPAP
jgi:hypothetical protein